MAGTAKSAGDQSADAKPASEKTELKATAKANEKKPGLQDKVQASAATDDKGATDAGSNAKTEPAIKTPNRAAMGSSQSSAHDRAGSVSAASQSEGVGSVTQRLRQAQNSAPLPKHQADHRSRPPQQQPGAATARQSRPEQDQVENPEGGESSSRRRAAAPARNRIAANDDLPSIGGLIYALQQKPSRRPFILAGVISLIWVSVAAILGWVYFGSEMAQVEQWTDIFTSPATLAMIGGLIIPVVIFWYLALLAWRTQELQLVSSAMTEVAVRLAEPDRIAEQQVASLGQNVRRQVAAMNDAISRALGRAGELEALVHNEVAALERSYGENEVRIRSLIEELASEREALANNSERVSQALKGLGGQVAQEVNNAANQVAQKISSASEGIAGTLGESGQKVTAAIASAGNSIDEQIKNRGNLITEQLVTQSKNAAEQVHQAAELMNQQIESSSQKTAALLSAKGNALVQTLSQMTDRVTRDVPQLLERLGGEQIRLSQVIDSATKNLASIETTLTQKTAGVSNTLETRTKHLQQVLTDHMRNIDHSMVERTKAIDAAFTQRVNELGGHLDDRMRQLNSAFVQQADVFDETFMKGVEAFRVTTEGMTTESIQSLESLATQAHALRNVSNGLLEQVHTLIDRFEVRGDDIIHAIKTLESSQQNIDALLGSRQTQLAGLIDNISNKTVDLDEMMRSYSHQLETSLTSAQKKARSLTDKLSSQSESSSRDALAELQKLRTNTQAHAEKVVQEMQARFADVNQEVKNQFTTLSKDISSTTQNLSQSALEATKNLEKTQNDLRNKIDQLPESTREGAAVMHRALGDQLRALEALQNASIDYARSDDIGRVRADINVGHQPQQRVEQRREGAPQITQANRGTNARQAAPGQQGSASRSQESWSMGDLLARASDEKVRNTSESRPGRNQETTAAGGGLKIDVIAKAIDHQTAASVWQRYQSGERGVFSRNLYSNDGQIAFDEIQNRYHADPAFRQTVLRYLSDFEKLLKEAQKRDPAGSLMMNYLVSETGRVYLLLAHASGRIV